MMYCRIVIACLLIYCIGCNIDKSARKPEFYNHSYPVSKVFFDTVTVQKRISEIIDSVEFITLETNSQSLVGEIQSVEIFKNYIVVLDDLGLGITIFLADGKFHAKIEQPYKDVKGKYKQFAIDRSKEEIVIYDSYQAKFLFYDFNGKLLRMKDVPFSFAGFTMLSGNFVYFSGYAPFYYNDAAAQPIKNADDSLVTLVYSDAGFKNIFKKECLFNLNAVDNSNTFSNESDFFTINAKECLFSYSYSNKIFQLSADGIKRIFEIQIPPSLMYPADYLDNPQYKNVRISNERKRKTEQLFWSVTDAFLIDSIKLLANIKSQDYHINYYLFDVQHQSAVSLSKNLVYDSISSYLPLTERKYYAAEPGLAYGFISAAFLIESFKNEEMLQVIKKRPVFKQLFGKINNLSNGVITKIHFKKDPFRH